MHYRDTNTSFYPILKFYFLGLLFVIFSCQSGNNDVKVAYLFAYFVGNGPGQEQVHYAISVDGYHYRALNGNKPVIDSKDISRSGGVRDPHILRGEDGDFYMVLTDLYVPEMGWENTAMILLKSPDLINWTHSVIDIPKTFPDKFGNVNRVWAPQTIYDPNAGKYMVYWSMRHNQDADIIYYAYANEDFTSLAAEPKQLLFKEGACIDGDIVYKDGKYRLFFKNEDEGAKGILKAVSNKINEGYVVGEDYVDQTDDQVEGSGTFQLINSDKYILMYDVYAMGKYQFCESADLENFKVIDSEITMDFKPRHGTVLPITDNELKALIGQWGSFDHLLIEAKGAALKKQNVYVNAKARKIHLPVKRGTDMTDLDPKFTTFPGISVSTEGPQDFSMGPLEYSIAVEGQGAEKYMVSVSEDHNPVLEGFYADPEILYAEKTGKYYLYPTTDGFHNWSGYYFKTFSSDNLVDWDDEGIILDLKKDVGWTDRNAWAPCIIEKRIDGAYKYFYYFTAAQKIGVAYADDPTGPFVDKGEPLIDWKPEGIDWGQEIDADAFTDPETAKSYLYWGNGYMAAAELSDDMLSVKKETLKVLTPDDTYREGTYVFYRNGKYFFMWSEDDTRSPNYKVRWAYSDTPLGPLTIPESNVVITQDTDQEIFATGHNSVLQIPGKDEWYLVYHRFTFPQGVKMGRSGGFHREVCIDQFEFTENGEVIQVKPTLKGIPPLEN